MGMSGPSLLIDLMINIKLVCTCTLYIYMKCGAKSRPFDYALTAYIMYHVQFEVVELHLTCISKDMYIHASYIMNNQYGILFTS